MKKSFTSLSGQKTKNSQKQIPYTTASQHVFLGNKFHQTLQNNNFNLNPTIIKNENKKKDEYKGYKDDKPFLITSKNLNQYKKEIKTLNNKKTKN